MPVSAGLPTASGRWSRWSAVSGRAAKRSARPRTLGIRQGGASATAWPVGCGCGTTTGRTTCCRRFSTGGQRSSAPCSKVCLGPSFVREARSATASRSAVPPHAEGRICCEVRKKGRPSYVTNVRLTWLAFGSGYNEQWSWRDIAAIGDPLGAFFDCRRRRARPALEAIPLQHCGKNPGALHDVSGAAIPGACWCPPEFHKREPSHGEPSIQVAVTSPREGQAQKALMRRRSCLAEESLGRSCTEACRSPSYFRRARVGTSNLKRPPGVELLEEFFAHRTGATAAPGGPSARPEALVLVGHALPRALARLRLDAAPPRSGHRPATTSACRSTTAPWKD